MHLPVSRIAIINAGLRMDSRRTPVHHRYSLSVAQVRNYDHLQPLRAVTTALPAKRAVSGEDQVY